MWTRTFLTPVVGIFSFYFLIVEGAHQIQLLIPKHRFPYFHECFDQIGQVLKIFICCSFRQKLSDFLIYETFKILSLEIGCWIRWARGPVRLFYNLPGAGQVSAVTTKPAWAAAAAEVACCEAAEEAGVLWRPILRVEEDSAGCFS